MLQEGPVELRPVRLRDGRAWTELRLRDQQWLEPWEGSVPGPVPSWEARTSAATWVATVRRQRREARAGRALPFALRVSGALAGQVTVGGVLRGAADSAHVGYWIERRLAGQGLMPAALALVVDHCFGPVALHRVEANVRPENVASRRVLEKLGFRQEGVRSRFLFIDGAWRDHECWALTAEDLADEPDGLVGRWRRTHRHAR